MKEMTELRHTLIKNNNLKENTLKHLESFSEIITFNQTNKENE